MNWILHGTGRRCERHGEEFALGEVCHRCVTDPGDLAIAGADSSATIDAEIVAFAHECRSNAKRMWRECSDLLDGTVRDQGTAVKCSDASIKWERLRLEALDKAAARKHLREAMAHERTMSGQRGPN